jgi:hypothetical protein
VAGVLGSAALGDPTASTETFGPDAEQIAHLLRAELQPGQPPTRIIAPGNGAGEVAYYLRRLQVDSSLLAADPGAAERLFIVQRLDRLGKKALAKSAGIDLGSWGEPIEYAQLPRATVWLLSRD